MMRGTPTAVRGQAMTEFVVVASFVLVPLFLLIPLLGKYVDIRHSTIQSARYEAWEYTVWNRNDSASKFGGYKYAIPTKSPEVIKQEAMKRFLSTTHIPLRKSDGNGWEHSHRNLLWTDHRGVPLYRPGGSNGADVSVDKTPDKLKVIQLLVDWTGKLFRVLAEVIRFVTANKDLGFTIMDANGYYRAESKTKVQPVNWIDPNNELAGINSFKRGLTFSAQASVLSEGWNAGGSDHAANQTAGLVPTKLLDNPVINTILDIAGYIAPEFHQIEFGYIDHESVPPKALKGYNGKVVCTTGNALTNPGLCDMQEGK